MDHESNGNEPGYPELPLTSTTEDADRDRRDAMIVIGFIVGGFVLGIFALLASILFF